jgi:D-glycero-D-manno-heptose 1,7-bisphosphate phosphatase
VAVASNQSGLGRGLFDVASLNEIHAKMHKAVAALGGRIDAVFYCPHTPDEACTCRKPLPGLFEQIADRFGVDLKSVPNVGDALRDLQAGALLGCPTHLVLTGKGAALRGRPLPQEYPLGTMVHDDLAAFAEWLTTRQAAPRVPAA